MVGIKDFGIPKCCMNCEIFDGEYGNCDIIGDTQDFEYQWNENRPFDCPLVEAIPKADYEARLKADMVAALKELQLEIEEIETGGDSWELGIKDECNAVIQKKIDTLEFELERGNNGNNVRQTD